jgi:hypothetical protein
MASAGNSTKRSKDKSSMLSGVSISGSRFAAATIGIPTLTSGIVKGFRAA